MSRRLWPFQPRAQSAAGPPPPSQRGRAHHADGRDAIFEERNQTGPHRNSAHEVLGAVDRVDHPLAALEDRRSTLFLAEDRVPGPLASQDRPDGFFDRLVGVGDRGEVGFGVDAQIEGAEAVEGDRVGPVGEGHCQLQVCRHFPLATHGCSPTMAG